ncbi:MAG TPA: GAF domain-containing SpoIIE family protein phosphatase [Bryobacteraceae bacterium]|nr:GAF domain-containing SpoIIE family protein phosphatase [Bryobacteraceae bacterium]
MSTPGMTGVRFRQRAELLDFLLEVSAATSESLTDLEGLLANIAEIIRKVIPYDLFAILLYFDKPKELRIRYAIGHREELVKRLVVQLGEGVTGAAALAREPVLVGDVRNDPRYLNAMDAVRSELAVPMIARGKLVGVIDVQSTRLEAYGEYDRALLRLIAARVAATIDNARLYRRVERQNRTLKILSHLSQEFSSILDLDILLRHLADAIKALIRYDAFSVLLLDREAGLLRHRFSLRFDQRIDQDNIPLGKGITGTAAVAREVIRSDNTIEDPRYIPFHHEVRSEVAVPLVVRDKVIGVIDLESNRVAHFTDDHVRMLSLLAPQIASAIENARLYGEIAMREKRIEEDLSAARDLQLALLPKEAPDILGLDIGIGYKPAHAVGGDLYDFFEYADDTALITFGDVSGKGVAAALYAALAGGLARIIAHRKRAPALVLKTFNQMLLERQVDARYVTLQVLLWSAHHRQLIIANAGAVPPVLCRKGEVINLRIEGVPVGLLPDREYDELTVHAEEGDVIVLASDGITDQMNPAGEEYGRARLDDIVRRTCGGSARSIVDAILADLDQFDESAPPFDDQTLVVIKIKAPPAGGIPTSLD